MSTEDQPEGETTRITRKGQVTIPKTLREEFGLEVGDELRWEVDEEGLVVRKATRSTGRGMLVEDDTPEHQREAMAEEITDEIREQRRNEWEPE